VVQGRLAGGEMLGAIMGWSLLTWRRGKRAVYGRGMIYAGVHQLMQSVLGL
jgi:hypothetical protein